MNILSEYSEFTGFHNVYQCSLFQLSEEAQIKNQGFKFKIKWFSSELCENLFLPLQDLPTLEIPSGKGY